MFPSILKVVLFQNNSNCSELARVQNIRQGWKCDYSRTIHEPSPTSFENLCYEFALEMIATARADVIIIHDKFSCRGLRQFLFRLYLKNKSKIPPLSW